MKGELSQVGLDEIIVNAGAQVKTDGPLCSSATVGEDMMTLFKVRLLAFVCHRYAYCSRTD